MRLKTTGTRLVFFFAKRVTSTQKEQALAQPRAYVYCWFHFCLEINNF